MITEKTDKNSNPKIRLKNVTKTFQDNGRQTLAIEDITLDIIEGKFTSIVGTSGCGKSTTLYMLAGFEKQSSGEILMDNKPVTAPAPDRGFVFQDYALFPWKTVLENVTFGLKLNGHDSEESRDIARDYLRMVKLSDFENAYPHTLSGGMKQRVSIARAIAYDPDVLLMDEPFGALDAQTRKHMQKELASILENFKKTVVFVTHSVIEAAYLSDYIVVMTARPGKIKAVIPVDLPKPRHYAQEDFVTVRRKVLSLLDEEVEKEINEDETQLARKGIL